MILFDIATENYSPICDDSLCFDTPTAGDGSDMHGGPEELGPAENSAQAKTQPHGEVGPVENSAPRRTRPPTTAENWAPIARPPHEPPAILSCTPGASWLPLRPHSAVAWLAAGRLILF